MEPKPVFGTSKQNKYFKRFTLKKAIKINIEFELIAMYFAKGIEKIGVFDLNKIPIALKKAKKVFQKLFSNNDKIEASF